MKRLITPLLLIPLLSACQSTRPPAPTPTNTSTLDLASGQLTTSDYSGQVRAGGGSVSSTDDGSIPALAKNIGDKEFTYASARLSLKDEPNVNEIASLENQHKDAVSNLAKFSPGTDPYSAAFNMVQSLGKQIFDYKKAKESRAKADEGAIDMRVLSVGAGHQLAPMRAAESFENVLKSRHVNPSLYSRTTTEKQTDISNTNDYAGVNAVLKTQLEMTRLELEIAKLKQAVTPTKPAPVVKPTEPKPVDPVTPEIPGQSPAARHKSLYPHVQLTGGNAGTATNHTLWKPGADQGADGLVVVTQHDLPKIRSLTILKGGETVKRMSIDDVVTAGNGYRLNWRFGGRGYSGAHTVVADTVDGQFSVQIPDGNKRADNLQMKKTGGAVEPIDPPPSTSSLFILEPDKLTLRSDFAAVVRKIDALANVNEPNTDPVFITAGKVGTHTWGIPKPLGSYPKGALPNTWRISLVKGAKIPDDVTYHRSIMQSFIRDGATKTYPPTTRE